MSLNPSVLCQAAALALGAAATWLGLEACLLSGASLPGLHSAAGWTAPALCLAWAAGAACGALRSARARRSADALATTQGAPGAAAAAANAPTMRAPAMLAPWTLASPVSSAARWLTAAAGCALAAPALLAACCNPAPPLSAVARVAAAALPFAPALFCLGVALPLIIAARAQRPEPAGAATPIVLAWVALGGAGAAWRWTPMLQAGLHPTTVGAGALAAAAVLCWLLAGLPAAEPRSVRRVESTARADTGPSAAHGTARRERRLALLALLLHAVACGLVLPALWRLAAAWDGDSLATRGHVALLLCLGALVASLDPMQASLRRGIGDALSWLLLAGCVTFAGGASGATSYRLVGALPFLVPAAVLVAAWRRVTTSSDDAPATGAAVRQGVAASPGAWLGVGLALGAAASGAGWLGASGVGTFRVLQVTGLGAATVMLVLGLLAGMPRWRATLLLAAVVALGWPGDAPVFPWQRIDPQDALLLQLEDARGVISVVGEPGGLAHREVAGRTEADDPVLARRMGRIAASFRPGAQQAVVLGLGNGLLTANLAAVTPASVQCIEPSEARLSLLSALPYDTGQSARGGAVALVHADPRAWLLEHPRGSDLIVGEPPVPERPGERTLCAREHFLAWRGALRDGGVAVQWFSLADMPWPAFASAARAFLHAFPDARLFVASLAADEPYVALVGNLVNGLPHGEAMDALLAAAPSAAGPTASVDVLDLYVCDAWTLGVRLRDEPMDSVTEPWVALRSEGRGDDRAWTSRTNLRLLAGLALPLDTTSFEARPVSDKENRRFGAELTARSAALASLLMARAAWQELNVAEPGSLSDTQRSALENELGATLLIAWKAAPGHLAVRDALLGWATDLAREDRWELAGALMQSAVDLAPDGKLLGMFGGVLLHLDHAEPARALLERARDLAPGDRVVLANLATAQLLTGQDDAARETLHAARDAWAPAELPPSLDLMRRVLDGDQAAVAPALELLRQLPAGGPSRHALERALQQSPADVPPQPR